MLTPNRLGGALLTRLDVRGVGDLADVLPRPGAGTDEPVEAVRAILADVRRRGDAAVREHTLRLDGVDLDHPAVAPAECTRALEAIPSELRRALEVAHDNIEAFHRAEAAPEVTWRQDGLTVRALRRPVDRAGCYVPGGRAAYPSTVLMTAVAARVAGVEEVVVCVPPGPGGRVPDVVLAAAALAGVDAVHRIGGAQAIAALAYGTASVPAVDVIVGPGNVYVATAKREVAGQGRVGVPAAFAGPSEVVVVADATVAPDVVAVDIVVQAEHGPHGLAWLVTWLDDVADAVTAAVAGLVDASPRRADIVATLDAGGYAVVVDGPEQAMAVANRIAPEHLELLTADPEALVPLVRHAGAVFLGATSPASLGDYVAGPNHVLPTAGTARFAGALTADDFTKVVHVVEADHDALRRLGPHVEVLAAAEGLPAHAQSIALRRRPR